MGALPLLTDRHPIGQAHLIAYFSDIGLSIIKPSDPATIGTARLVSGLISCRSSFHVIILQNWDCKYG